MNVRATQGTAAASWVLLARRGCLIDHTSFWKEAEQCLYCDIPFRRAYRPAPKGRLGVLPWRVSGTAQWLRRFGRWPCRGSPATYMKIAKGERQYRLVSSSLARMDCPKRTAPAPPGRLRRRGCSPPRSAFRRRCSRRASRCGACPVIGGYRFSGLPLTANRAHWQIWRTLAVGARRAFRRG